MSRALCRRSVGGVVARIRLFSAFGSILFIVSVTVLSMSYVGNMVFLTISHVGTVGARVFCNSFTGGHRWNHGVF